MERARRPTVDAVPEDIVPPRGDSTKALHVQGDKLAGGVDLWVQLVHPQNTPVDLSAYAGLSFWARLTSPSGRLIVATTNTASGASPFSAAESSASPWFAQSLAASAQWQRFILLFDDFHQGVLGGGSSGQPLALTAITGFDFVVGLGAESYDLWIDDLALLCRGACSPHPFF